jgi:hypothetical protein
MPQEPTPRTMLEKIGGWTLGRTLGRGAYGEAEDATAVNPFLLPGDTLSKSNNMLTRQPTSGRRPIPAATKPRVRFCLHSTVTPFGR